MDEDLRDRPVLKLDSRLVCKYEIISVIGKGSFSQVLRVKHRVTNQFFAVKLVSSDCGTVNNELSILSRVSHPYVIKLEEVNIVEFKFNGLNKKKKILFKNLIYFGKNKLID